MAALVKSVPKTPFFFRIYAEDGQGIMYKADKQLNPDTYDCPGSRKIGTTSDGIKIWQIGGYSDVMPVASMYQIVDPSITPLSKGETAHFVDANKLDKSLKNQSLYFDGIGFWFVEKGRGRSRSRSRSGSRNRTSKANAKPRAKSKTRAKSRSGR